MVIPELLLALARITSQLNYHRIPLLASLSPFVSLLAIFSIRLQPWLTL